MLKRIVNKDYDARGYVPYVHACYPPTSRWLWSHNNSGKDGSEWITTLYTTYVDKVSRCELLEFAPGGDLLPRLIQNQTLSENTTRVLAAEIFMAIRARHAAGYECSYGNIKPENIFIGRDGHIKLSDCERVPSRDQHVRHTFQDCHISIFSTASHTVSYPDHAGRSG